MALNALRTEMVTFTGTPGIEVNGITVGYKAEYTERTGTEAKYHAIEGRTSDVASDANHKGQYYIQLGEQLYDGKLKLDNNDIDAFGRPSRKWEFDGKAIGTYAKMEQLDKEYVGEVTGKDFYDELGAKTIEDYDVYCYVDGVWTDGKGADTTILGRTAASLGAYFNKQDMNKNNKAGVGGTGVGTLTQVFVDHEDDEVYVVVINTYLAIVDKDYDEKKEETPITAYSIEKKSDEYVKVAKNGKETESFKLAVEDFPEAKDMKKDDALLITVADGDVQTVKSAEVVSGVHISAFKLQDNVTADGTKYKYTTTAGYKAEDLDQYTDIDKTNLKDRTYDIYLDVYGNLIGLEEIDAPNNYVFITGIDLNTSHLVNQTADANAIFIDGTTSVIKINMTKSTWESSLATDDDKALLNTWCTYTKNGDTYTVKEVKSTDTNANNYPLSGVGNNTSKLAQFHQKADINGVDQKFDIKTKNMRLKGQAYGVPNTTPFRFVYGDTDSVYMTAKLGELQKTGANYGVIKGVSSVITGIADANLTVWDSATAADKADDSKVDGKDNADSPVVGTSSTGVYTLYNSDGLVIAAIVVGDDGATSKSLVYVTSSNLDWESDNDANSATRAANDGLWTWSREVVLNGEKTSITEVGDECEHINNTNMLQYHWYQISRDANGNVTNAELANTLWTRGDRTQFVSEYSKINDTVETTGVDTVLYQTDGGDLGAGKGFGAGAKLEVRGTNTLAVTTVSGSGIYLDKNVNAVLQYWNKNTKQTEVLTGEGIEDLKDMLDIVNDLTFSDKGRTNEYDVGTVNNSQFYLSALIEDGFAKTVVIYDSYNNYERPGADIKDPTSYTLRLKGNLIDKINPTIVEYIQDGKTYTATGLPYGNDSAAYVEYKIPVVNSGVVIYDNDVVAVTGGYKEYPYDAPYTGMINVYATPKQNGIGSSTLNFVLRGDLTLDNVPTDGESTDEFYTLTLDTTVTSPKVYVGGTEITSQGVASLTGTAYQIKAGATVMVDSTVFNETGTINLTGTKKDADGNDVNVEIKATANAGSHRMSFKMDANVTLTAADKAATYAVKIMDSGITALSFENAGGALSTQPTKGADGTYLVKASDNVTVIKATMASGGTTNIVANTTGDAFTWGVKDQGIFANTATGGIDVTFGPSHTLDTDLYVFSAVKVKFDTTTANGKFRFMDGVINGAISDDWNTFYVAPGTNLTVAKNGGDALIKVAGGNAAPDCAAYADALKGTETITVEVAKADMDLYGAYRVIVHGVGASDTIGVGAGAATFKSGDFVKIGNTIKVKQNVGGNAVVLVDEAKPYVVDPTNSTTLAVNFSFTNLYVATEIVLKANSGIELQRKTDNGNFVTFAKASTSDVKVYVQPGEEITATSTNTNNLTFTKTTLGDQGDIPAGGDLSVTFEVGDIGITIDAT